MVCFVYFIINIEIIKIIKKNISIFKMSVINKQYIERDNISDAGIIFITSNDPISRIIVSITKQEFSSIGFYYRTSATGTSQIRVITVDIFGVHAPQWLKPGDTINDLIDNPIISQIAIKKLRSIYDNGTINEEKTKSLHTNFRTAIAQVMGTKGEMSLRDAISQLFGYPTNSTHCGLTAIEMVNKVISLIGKWEEISSNDTVSIDSFEICKLPMVESQNAHAKVQLIGYLSSKLNPDINLACKQIQSYIVPNNLFDDIQYISLPPRNLVQQELALADSIVSHRSYLNRAVGTFIDMLLVDHDFFKVVVTGIHKGKIRENLDTKLLEEVISELYNSKKDLINKVVSWISSGQIHPNDLKSLISHFNNNSSIIHNLTKVQQGQPINPPEEDKVILYTSNPHLLHTTITELHGQLEKSLQNLHDKKSVCLDINKLSSLINELSKSHNLSLRPLSPISGETSYSAVVTINDINSSLPVTLKNGKEILIPLSNPNLSHFDRNILIEILATIDSHPYNPKYDHIRSNIVDKLAC